MVRDNELIATVSAAVAILGYLRLCFGRVFARLDDMAKGIAAGIMQQEAIHRQLASEPGVVQYTVISREADGTINQRHSSADTEYPFKLWKDLESGVPGQHWFLQDGSVLGYLEF